MEYHINTTGPLASPRNVRPAGLCQLCANYATFSCPKNHLIRQAGHAMEVTRCESFEDEEYSDKPPIR